MIKPRSCCCKTLFNNFHYNNDIINVTKSLECLRTFSPPTFLLLAYTFQYKSFGFAFSKIGFIFATLFTEATIILLWDSLDVDILGDGNIVTEGTSKIDPLSTGHFSIILNLFNLLLVILLFSWIVCHVGFHFKSF